MCDDSLKPVWISHAHPDHFLQLDLIVDRVPGVEVLITRNVLADLEADGPWMFDLLRGKLGAEAAGRLVLPTALEGPSVPLGDHTLERFAEENRSRRSSPDTGPPAGSRCSRPPATICARSRPWCKPGAPRPHVR
jgi:hypothetical protein